MLANPSKKSSVKIWLGVGIILLVVIAFLVASFAITITQKRTLTAGEDNYQFHRPLFSIRSAAQDITLENELRGLGVILVNMRRAEEIPPVIVTVTNPVTGEQLDQVTIAPVAIADDKFAVAQFARPILPSAHNVVRISFTAPSATAQNPIGVRFHPNNPYPPSGRLENGQLATGDLALQLHERVQVWRYISTTILESSQQFRLLGVAVAALLVALLSIQLGWQSRSALFKRRLQLGILVVVALVALASRARWLPSFYGVSGGDPYNYLAITQQLTKFDNPFAISKRLPGFPLLLIPAYLTPIDDILWMRLISITSAAVAVFLVAILARTLQLPWSIQLLAAVLLAIHKDFWWVSLRPEPYTFYTVLLLLGLILFFNLRSLGHKLAFGLVIGYGAMTRQEGFVVAAIYGLMALTFGRFLLDLPSAGPGWKKMLPAPGALPSFAKSLVAMFLPALVVVLPFFIHNTLAYGNPLYTEYFEGDRLQIVNSVPAFFDSLGATWGVLGSMWRPQWDLLYRIPLTSTLFLSAVASMIVWWFISYTAFYRRSTAIRILLAAAWAAQLCCTVWLVAAQRGVFYEVVMVISAAALLTGLIPFLTAASWRGGIVLVIAASQILTALWFHPFAKHYQQAYPILVLLLASAIAPTIAARYAKHLSINGTRGLMTLSRFSLVAPLLLVALFLHASLPTFIDKYNRSVALDNVVYRATALAQQLPGPHGADQPYLPVRLYFNEDAHYFFGDEPHTPQQALAWIKEHRVRTLIETNNNAAFKSPPADWELIKSFKAEGKDEHIYESRVYNIPDGAI